MKIILIILLFQFSALLIKAQTQETCPQPTPHGWVVISYRACAGCCGADGKLVQMPTIKRVDNLPQGTSLEMCPQTTPQGWAVISYRDCAGCCGADGKLVKMPTIKKL